MLSIARGYSPDYLLKEVATGRENYYTDAVTDGEPPGRWWGAGAATLGLEGEVDAQDMRPLYERFLDPRAEGFRDPEAWGSVPTLGHAGRAYKDAEELYAEAIEREPDATPERRDELRVEAGKAERQNLAFLDLTFSVQKSVTLLHTAFEAEEVKARTAGLDDEAAVWAGRREAVERAIWKGNNAALTYLQDHAGYARVGHHGGAAGRWIDAHTWTVASFFQHDSRDHDPQLHIHNGVVNRVLCDDGVWRTLDSRAIHKLRPAAGAIADRTTDEALMEDLWVGMQWRPDGAAREVTAVLPAARDMFSSRKHKIDAKTAEIVAAYEAEHGRPASAMEVDRIKREATMATRARKSHTGETREEFLTRVQEKLQGEVRDGLTGIAHTAVAQATARGVAPEVGRFDPVQVVADAVESLQAKQASFTHADLMREINDLLPARLGSSERVAELLHGLADVGVELTEPVEETDAPGAGLEPEAFRLNNGHSAFEAPGGPSRVTPDHLRSENRLRAATEPRDGERLTHAQARAFVARLRGEGIELGVDQAAALTGVLTSGARLETLIGPAGTGKSFVVGSLAGAWSDPAHQPAGPDGAPVGPARRVFGLATSQAATEVLTAEGLTASNTAAWLSAQQRLTQTRQHGRSPIESDEGWRLGRGDVVVVDESSMADTAALVAVLGYVEAAGAKMLLVGDHRQLTAVGAGGAMELVAQAGARYELTDARRFHHAWERDASLRLRAGDPGVVAEYHRQGRLLDAGTIAEAEASAAAAWLADSLGGRRSLLVVDSNDAAGRVSRSIRDELVRLGRVEEFGLPWRDGSFAGVGDVVQGRRLAWELAGYEGNRRGPINREHYRVTGVRDDGALEVEVLGRRDQFLENADANAGDAGEGVRVRERLVLPPQYVARDTTLAYAVTVHAAEGATVDTSHTVATPTTSVNALYTGGSRGQACNTFHVVTVTGPDDRADGGPEHTVARDPRAVLSTVLETREVTDQQNRSATAAREDAAQWARSVRTGAERFADGAHEASRERTVRHLDELAAAELLDPHVRARIAAEDGSAGLTRMLRQIELAGHDPRHALREAVAGRSFDGARHVTDVLLGRLREDGRRDGRGFDPVTDTWAARVPADVGQEWVAYLGVVAEGTDRETAALGARLAEAPTRWAIEAIGPVPEPDSADGDDNTAARAQWQAQAGAIAAHRQIRGHTVGDDDPAANDEHQRGEQDAGERAMEPVGERGGREPSVVELLGSAPARAQAEAYSAYRAAYRSTSLPEHRRDLLELSDAGHRARVRAAKREEAWGPAYVDDTLAGTRQARDHARQRAELGRAEAHAAQQIGDTEQREQRAREVEHADALVDVLDREVDKLDALAAVRSGWLADTAMTRTLGHESENYLAERGISTEPEQQVSAEEWRTSEHAARVEDDPYRDITDTDLTSHDQTADDHNDHRDDRQDDRQVEEPARADADEPADSVIPDERAAIARDRAELDEDTVHVATPDEVDKAADLARRVQIETRNRAALDAQHQADEQAARNEELARWHTNDQVAETTTDDDADVLESADEWPTE